MKGMSEMMGDEPDPDEVERPAVSGFLSLDHVEGMRLEGGRVTVLERNAGDDGHRTCPAKMRANDLFTLLLLLLLLPSLPLNPFRCQLLWH
jgi:hypothetical protein